ncbi:ABC transporter ATP-binding protein [Clostridium sp. DMHC 10]|uniref:ABC transporter ATP-binding protein n=1 Tax=Clostridium sp. DMHC 10 TaxID=747377 RepID=UPI00069CE876|nr:ABC transporter ATP-binding protein [Clostridium sp. DMHC 10]KOF55609.1 ABC transporter ATP-binding protein [Clostridium sp. DMHC 10]
MERKVLEVISLKKYYKGNKAVDGISFHLNAGEIVGLTGPNGAGKTTTIKCILGLLRKTKGKVLVDGIDSIKQESKYKLAYIPETPDIYPMLTVWEHLKFIALAYYIDDWQEYGNEILKRFDLYDKKNILGRDLSKGMKQKLSICCALLHKPDVFLVDEPLIGLDPKAIRELKDAFKALRAEGKSLLISTHMLDTAEGLCDRIVVLKKGTLILEGTIEDLRLKVNAGEDSSLEDLFLEVTEDEEK